MLEVCPGPRAFIFNLGTQSPWVGTKAIPIFLTLKHLMNKDGCATRALPLSWPVVFVGGWLRSADDLHLAGLWMEGGRLPNQGHQQASDLGGPHIQQSRGQGTWERAWSSSQFATEALNVWSHPACGRKQQPRAALKRQISHRNVFGYEDL